MFSQGGTSFHVAPVTFDLVQNPNGSFGTGAPHDLELPVFTLFTDPKTPTVLSFHGLTASNMFVSASHDCIGGFDPAIFDPKVCKSTAEGDVFEHDGSLQAFLSLEEADAIQFGSNNETLCAVLAGDPHNLQCQRTNGVIDFRGDWCSATNGPATSTCADAVLVKADFAASAVQIH
jgi:hypothetical protein